MDIKKLLSLVPEGEHIAVRFENNKNETRHVITKTVMQQGNRRTFVFKLYEIDNGSIRFTKQEANNPLELEQYIS